MWLSRVNCPTWHSKCLDLHLFRHLCIQQVVMTAHSTLALPECHCCESVCWLDLFQEGKVPAELLGTGSLVLFNLIEQLL